MAMWGLTVKHFQKGDKEGSAFVEKRGIIVETCDFDIIFGLFHIHNFITF